MFAGIVKGTGRILAVENRGGDRRLVVGFGDVAFETPMPGGSVAVNGVCLTATDPAADRFAADVSSATLEVTTLGRLEPGHRVNLEPPLRLGERLDGHLVTGHVDGVGRVLALTEAARSVALEIGMPTGLARYVARKGSIAVDGVSLTVNAVSRDRFEVNIIPHTQAVTIISGYAVGTPVNIEVDMVARYLERLVAPEAGGISLGLLKDYGFANHE